MAADAFNPQHCHSKYELSESNTKVTNTNIRKDVGAYLKNTVTRGIHQWRFKITKKTAGVSIVLGVWKAKYQISTEQGLRASQARGKYYGWNVSYRKLTYGDTGTGKGYGHTYVKEGDVIDMILDLNEWKLSYNLNGKGLGPAFVGIERCEYVVGVCIYSDVYSLKLLSYIAPAVADQDDVKNTESDELKEENKNLKQQIETAIQESARNTTKLQSELSLKIAMINSLKDEIKSKDKEKRDVMSERDMLQQEMQRLRQQNQTLIQENQKKDHEVQDMKQKIKEHQEYKIEMERKYKQVNEANSKLNEECKEYQLNLQEMTGKYNKLLRKSRINEEEYENWDSDLICDWIVSLDKEYERYEDKLRTNMKKEGMDGSVLGELDKNDLHRFGVENIKHKIAMIKHIKRITSVQAKQQQIAIPQMNEGNNAAPTAYI